MTDKVKIGIAKIIESGSRAPSNLSQGPEAMEGGGLPQLLERLGCDLVESKTATLIPEEEKEYGTWHRLGLANRHLRDIVADQRRSGLFTLGLLSNCNALMGMLAGHQHGGPTKRPLRVGLIWIDAHMDANPCATSPSGRSQLMFMPESQMIHGPLKTRIASVEIRNGFHRLR